MLAAVVSARCTSVLQSAVSLVQIPFSFSLRRVKPLLFHTCSLFYVADWSEGCVLFFIWILSCSGEVQPFTVSLHRSTLIQSEPALESKNLG